MSSICALISSQTIGEFPTWKPLLALKLLISESYAHHYMIRNVFFTPMFWVFESELYGSKHLMMIPWFFFIFYFNIMVGSLIFLWKPSFFELPCVRFFFSLSISLEDCYPSYFINLSPLYWSLMQGYQGYFSFKVISYERYIFTYLPEKCGLCILCSYGGAG